MSKSNHEKERAMNRIYDKDKRIYQHFGSVTISLAEMDEYDRLIRRQIVRGRSARRRLIQHRQSWGH